MIFFLNLKYYLRLFANPEARLFNFLYIYENRCSTRSTPLRKWTYRRKSCWGTYALALATWVQQLRTFLQELRRQSHLMQLRCCSMLLQTAVAGWWIAAVACASSKLVHIWIINALLSSPSSVPPLLALSAWTVVLSSANAGK